MTDSDEPVVPLMAVPDCLRSRAVPACPRSRAGQGCPKSGDW